MRLEERARNFRKELLMRNFPLDRVPELAATREEARELLDGVSLHVNDTRLSPNSLEVYGLHFRICR